MKCKCKKCKWYDRGTCQNKDSKFTHLAVFFDWGGCNLFQESYRDRIQSEKRNAKINTTLRYG